MQSSSGSKHKVPMKSPFSTSGTAPALANKDSAKSQSGPAPGPVVTGSLNPMRSVKGAPSAVAVGKRKREDNKPKKSKPISEAEAAALKAREAARKRVEEREKSLLGLYQTR